MAKHPKHAGVYAIRHIESGRCYIGSAKNIYARWRDHKSDLRRGLHHCPHLQNAWNKYGESAFVFDVLEACFADVVALRHREEVWLARAGKNRYNVSRFADAASAAKHSPERRAATSRRMMGNKHGAGSHYCGFLAADDVVEILYRYATGESTKSIAEKFRVTQTNIIRIVGRKIWATVPVSPDIEAACRTRIVRRASGIAGEKNHKAKLTRGIVEEARRRHADGESYTKLAKDYGVSLAGMRFAISGRTWKQKPEPHLLDVEIPERPVPPEPNPLLKTKQRRR